jgi:hypothetical protein
MRREKEEYEKRHARNYRMPPKSNKQNIATTPQITKLIVESNLKRQSPCISIILNRTQMQWDKILAKARTNSVPISFTTQ